MADDGFEAKSLVDVTTEETRITATDLAGNTFEVDTRGWMESDSGPRLTMRADETISGHVTELRVDAEQLSYSSLDASTADIVESTDVEHLHMGAEYHPQSSVKLAFPDGSYRVRASTGLTTLLRTDDAFTLFWNAEDQRTVLTFEQPALVTLGFRSSVEHPRATLTVGPSVADVATAVSHLSASHRTVEPERSFPTMRGHPPALELGDETEIPDPVRERTPDTGIEIVVPPSLDALLPVAPLAYYLSARVRVGDDAKLAVPEAGFEYGLDPMPELQYQVARLLRRVFALDCVVRNAGPWGASVEELDALERELPGFDVEAWYAQSARERVVTYLNCEFGRVAEELPPWRHWVRVPSERDALEALPGMLSDGAAVFVPPVEGDRIRDATDAGRAPDWELVTGRFEGERDDPWTRGYVGTYTAHRNRLTDATRADDHTVVTVVAASSVTEPVADWLADRYDRRLDDRGTVRYRRIRSRQALAELFAEHTDLLHFVGECSPTGLVCPDADLNAGLLAQNNVKQFILDTTAETTRRDAVSIAQDVVDRGSVAGVVSRSETRAQPADETANATYPPFTVGGLTRHGFATESARRIAERVHDGAELAVVGDGAYREHSTGFPSFVLELEERDSDPFELSAHTLSVAPGTAIGGFGPHIALCGKQLTHTLGAEWFRKNVVDDEDDIVVYDGDLYWPEETRRLLYPMA